MSTSKVEPFMPAQIAQSHTVVWLPTVQRELAQIALKDMKLVVISLVVTAVALSGSSCDKQKSQQPAVSGMSAVPAKAIFAGGEPVTINVKLTNRGAHDCRMSGAVDGVVTIGSLTLGGTGVIPGLTTGTHIDGFNSFINSYMTVVAPGHDLTMTMVSRKVGPGSGQMSLESSTAEAGGRAAVALWPVEKAGKYELTLSYRLPPNFSGACDVSPAPVKVSFEVQS